MIANIFGPTELLIVVGVVVLLFGSSQLPKLARSVGDASRELKRAQEEHEAVPVAAREHDDRVTLTRGELDRMLAQRGHQDPRS